MRYLPSSIFELSSAMERGVLRRVRGYIIMDSGYYAACAGLAAQTQALELVANNLANLGTAGYRGAASDVSFAAGWRRNGVAGIP